MLVFAIILNIFWVFISLLSRGINLSGFAMVFPEFIQKANNGFYYEVSNKSMPFELFLIVFTLAFIFYYVAILKVKKTKVNKNNILIIFIAAALMRLVLVPSIPIHENDVYRYIWDGKVAIAGINPYKYPPQQAVIKPSDDSDTELIKDYETLKTLREEDRKYYNRIGYKDVATIYPPMTQIFFIISNSLSRGSIASMKFLLIIFDMLAVFLIYKILGRLKLNPLCLIIYAWSPLVLKELANSGHYDSLSIVCVLASIYFILAKKSKLSGAMMGLGFLTKFYPLIFIPFFLRKKDYKAFVTALLIIVLGYIPFFVWGNVNLIEVFSGLGSYTKSWAINGGIFELINSSLALVLTEPYYFSKGICAISFVVIWFYFFIKTDTDDLSVVRSFSFVLTALLLLSPVGDPWYFCWLIPFLALFRFKCLIALTYLLILSYFDFTREFGILKLGQFEIDKLVLLQYIPFYILLIWELKIKMKSSKVEGQKQPCIQ